MMPEKDRKRAIIEGVKPEVDGGRFPIKRVVGEDVVVEADIFADSHDSLSCILKYRKDGTPRWTEAPMTYLVNDRWQGVFVVHDTGRFLYTVEAWVGRFVTWKGNLSNIILVVVNLDPHHVHSGWLTLPLADFGIDEDRPYQVHDLLSDARYLWNGPRNYVELDPRTVPGHIFRLRRRVRTERDFDYFM